MNKWLLALLIVVGIPLLVWGCAFAFTSHVPDTTTYTCKFQDVTYQCPTNIKAPTHYNQQFGFGVFDWRDPRASWTGDSNAGIIGICFVPDNNTCNCMVSGYPAHSYYYNDTYALDIYVSPDEEWQFMTPNEEFFNTFKNTVKIDPKVYNTTRNEINVEWD